MKRIVVGVDGSTEAERALRWAVAEGGRHGASVVAVMAWAYLEQHHADKDAPFDPSYGEEQALAALQASIETTGTSGSVEPRVVCDLPARALIDAGGEADLLVVGARGLGGFKGLVLGSVSERVLEHASCPVALVRDEFAASAEGPVVVGVDGSAVAMAALRWAAVEARVRGALLRVVHTWHLPFFAVPTTEDVVSAVEQAARGTLDRTLEDPVLAGLDVEAHLMCRGAASGLLELGDGASLIVVGSRGLGRFERVLLGSTSRQLAHHSPCPMVVVPQPPSTGP